MRESLTELEQRIQTIEERKDLEQKQREKSQSIAELSLTFADDMRDKVDFEDLVVMQQIDSLQKRLKHVELFSQVSGFKASSVDSK